MGAKTYKIKITPRTEQKFCAVKPHIIEITTEDIEWSMDQYQRNRDALTWEVIKD